MVVSIQYFACLLLMTDRSGADVVLWELFFPDHWAHWFIAQQYGTKNLMPNVLYYYYNYTNFSIINTIFWNYFLTQGAKKCLPKHNVTVLTPNHTQSDCHNIFFSILSFIALKLLEFVRVIFFNYQCGVTRSCWVYDGLSLTLEKVISRQTLLTTHCSSCIESLHFCPRLTPM